MQVFPFPVGKVKRLAGPPQLLLLVMHLESPMSDVPGRSLQEVYITGGQARGLNHHLGSCPNMVRM